MTRLKPCPFCGEEVKEVKLEDRGYLTICCGLVGSMISVAEWNTRPIEGNLKEHIAELELIVGRQANELRFENANWTAAMTKQQEHIAKLEAEHRWIPVSERLPEESSEVLGVTFFGNMRIYDYFGKSWFSSGRNLDKPTHWMPLPEPPEVTE